MARPTRNRLASSLLVVAGVALLGSAAIASAAEDVSGPAAKHSQAMTRGMSHDEAREAAAAPADVATIQARVKTHLDWLNKGATHEQARDATTAPVDVATVQARIQRHLGWMNKGVSYDQARG